MKNIEEVVKSELTHSFYSAGKKNEYNATRVYDLTRSVTDLIEQRTSFRKVWIEVFVTYPQQEALRCMQRIYKALKLPIPPDLRPEEDVK